MLSIKSTKSAGLVEVTVDGPVSKSDYEAVVGEIDRLLKTHEKLNVIEVVCDIGWVDFEVWWKDMIFHLTHRRWLNRVAVVSDKGWVGPFTRFFAPFYPAEIRTFPLSGLEEARRWAKVGNVVKAAA